MEYKKSRKHNKLRIVSFLLIVCFMMPIYFACAESQSASQQKKVNTVLHEFFHHINEREYSKAYDMLSSDTQNIINATTFSSRYESLFETLSIDDMDLNIRQVSSNEDEVVSCSYTLTYHSAICGEIANYYQIIMMPSGNNTWQIDWTPEMIFPDMEWSDSIKITRIRATRGEIYAGNVPLAVNTSGLAVNALPDKIEDIEKFASEISPLIKVDAEKILEKLGKVTIQGMVNTDYIRLRSEPSTEAKQLNTLIRGDTMTILDDGKVYTRYIEPEIEEEKPNILARIFGFSESFSFENPYEVETAPDLTQSESFYRVRYHTAQNSSRYMDGYVYQPYITVRSNPDAITLTTLYQDEISDLEYTKLKNMAGVQIDSESFKYRSYPEGAAFFHTVGYTDQIKEEQLIKLQEEGKGHLYDASSLLGQIGIESNYEEELRGEDGFEIYIANENGAKKQTLFSKKAKNGLDITLSIDAKLQKRAYDLMRLYLKDDQTGSIVVSDPQTGAIKASVSYPSVDPSEFLRMSSAEIVALNEDPKTPLFNRSTQGLYVPGSIFKPFTAVVAMENDVIGVNSVFPFEIVDNKWTPDHTAGETPSGIPWNYPAIARIENRNGTCDFKTAMRFSDNIFFAWAAMNVGAETFLDYCENKLGFEQTIPYDLPVSKSSIFRGTSDPESQEFNIKFLADSGYGQGEMLMSPIHVASIFGAFANNGDAMRPYLIESMDRAEGLHSINNYTVEPNIWKENVITDEYVKAKIKESLEDVMQNGTGARVDAPYSLAGKTGTAEKIKNKTDIAWLVSYKASNPSNYLTVVNFECAVKEGDARYPMTSLLFDYDANLPDSIDSYSSSGIKVVDLDANLP